MRILSFDIGTTNIKAVLYDGNRNKNKYMQRINTIEDGEKRYQNVDEIFDFIDNLIQKIPNLNRVVLSVPMHTTILLDDKYEPLSEMMLWSDRRSRHLLEVIPEIVKEEIQSSTHVPLHSMTPFSKILWLNEQKLKYSYISDLKSYLMKKLTGNFVTDLSSAAAWGMLNHKNLVWDEYILKYLNISKNVLPSLSEPNRIYKSGDIDVVIGSTDGVMANKGVSPEKEQLVLSIGTSIGLRRLTRNKELKKNMFSYYAGGNYFLEGTASNNGGNLFEYVNAHIMKISFEDYTSLVNQAPPKVMAIPYAYGERGPYWIENVTLKWDRECSNIDKVHSLLLAMFANLKIMFEMSASQTDNDILVTGNFLSNDNISQFTADMLERTIIISNGEEAVCNAGVGIISQNLKKFVPEENSKNLEYINKVMKYIESEVNYGQKNYSEVI